MLITDLVLYILILQQKPFAAIPISHKKLFHRLY